MVFRTQIKSMISAGTVLLTLGLTALAWFGLGALTPVQNSTAGDLARISMVAVLVPTVTLLTLRHSILKNRKDLTWTVGSGLVAGAVLAEIHLLCTMLT